MASKEASRLAAAEGEITSAPPKRRFPRKFGGRAVTRVSWGFADQAVSSLTNFAISFFLAHTLAPAAFGAFSLTYVSYGFALTTARGLTTDPLVVRYSGVEDGKWRRATSWAAGLAVVLGLVAGTVCLVVAFVLGGTAGSGFLALGLTLPGLVLQDCWRFCFFAAGRGRQAFLNDSIWAVLMIPALVVLHITGHTTVFWAVLAWGGSASAAAAAGIWQAKALPKLLHGWTWLYLHRDLGPRYMAEGSVASGAGQVKVYFMSGFLGLAAVGWLQACNTIFGPMSVLLAAMGLVTIPEAARVLRRAPSRLGLFCLVTASGASAVAVLWGVTLLVGLPRGLGNIMLGPIWRPTLPLVLPMTVSTVAFCSGLGPGVVLHALGASRRSLRLVVFSAVTSVICSIAGALVLGAPGVVWGSAVGGFIAGAVSWWQLRVALREHNLPQDGIRILARRFTLAAHSARHTRSGLTNGPPLPAWRDPLEGKDLPDGRGAAEVGKRTDDLRR
jgi:O-antigen/teichoic acid export membrane protein